MTARDFFLAADAALLHTTYPENLECLCCRGPSFGQALCEDCASLFEDERLTGELCPLCGHPLSEDGNCGFCTKDGLLARSACRHKGAARDLVHTLKYEGISAAAAVLADGMAEAARPFLPIDCVTWVTMPKRRRRERGIDHGRVLAEALALRLNAPARQLLTRTERRRETTQAGLDAAGRMKNLRDLFSCEGNVTGRILLADDVMTTGSTARVCRDALLSAGAEAVYVVTATQA